MTSLGSSNPVMPGCAGGPGSPGPAGTMSLKAGRELSSEMAAVRVGKPGGSGLIVFLRPLGSVHTSASETGSVQPGSGFPGCPAPSPWQRRPTTMRGGLGALHLCCTYVRRAQLTSQLRVGLLACRFSALDSERYALLGACRAPRSRGK